MKYLSLLMICSIAMLLSVKVSAQQGRNEFQVHGTVRGKGGNPLVGASIFDITSGSGTITDQEGKFIIEAKAGDTLEFSIIGFETRKMLVTRTERSLSVIMKQSANELNQVVVIGYGSSKREDLTGSIASVKASDIIKSTNMSINEALQGRAAGVSVTADGGQPGAPVSIYIRAGSSITASNDPLYVVDGFPQLGGSNLNINPNDIASIEILKDASATAIYGARGANGVIIITTKSGQAGKFSISYNTYFSVQKLAREIKVINTLQYAEAQHYLTADPLNSELGDSLWYNWPTYKDSVDHDWQAAVYRPALMQSHDLSFTGGTSTLKVAGSLSLTDQNGIAVGTGYKRYTGRLNATADISKFVTSQTEISLTYGDQTGPSFTGDGGITYSAVKGSPFRPPNTDLNQYLEAHGMSPGGSFGRDPIVDLLQPVLDNSSSFASLNSALSFNLMEGLILKISGGMEYTDDASNSFWNSNTSEGAFIGGEASKDNSVEIDLLNENTLNYSKSFGKAGDLSALLGFSMQTSTSSFTNVSNQNYQIQNLGYNNMSFASVYRNPNTGKSYQGLVSYFGRIHYALANKYMLTGTLRADGSSKFAAQKYGYFPSGGIAWMVSQEKFMQKFMPAIASLKLRYSIGETGNQSIPPYSTFTSYGSTSYPAVMNNQIVVGLIPTQVGNPNLKWETTIQQDLGIELGLLNNRIFITGDAYLKRSKNLLLAAPISFYSGFSSVIKNVGEVQVKGLELDLKSVNVDSKLRWTTDFNIAFSRSLVLKLNNGQSSFFIGSVGRYDGRNGYPYIVQVGKPLGEMWGYVYAGIANTQEALAAAPITTVQDIEQGSRIYKDISGPKGVPDGVVNSYDQTVIGNGNPKFFGGFSNDLSYGSFDLSFLFVFRYGNDILNAAKAEEYQMTAFQGGPESLMTRWTPETPQINSERWNGPDNEYDYLSSWMVEDGSFLRLKNIQLSYNFKPTLFKHIPIQSLRLYVTAENVLTFTRYTGYDPEVNSLNSLITPGADNGAYPGTKTYVLGLNVSF